jgi:hypothetical protein
MWKKLALLGFLMLVSVGMAYTVSASEALRGLVLLVFGRNEIKIDEAMIPHFIKLSEEQRAKAVEIALADASIRELLKGVDNYYISVYEILDIEETKLRGREHKGRVMELIPKEGLALVELRIYKDYGDEIGLRVVRVTVNLLVERVERIAVLPELRKPKAQGNVQSAEEAIQIGRQFLDGIGSVTGEVLSVKLDERNPNFYWHEVAKFEKPEIEGLRTCWIVRFEQAHRPGHWFEVWIDTQTGEVIGGGQCR